MDKYFVQGATLTGLANSVRNVTGNTGNLTPSTMKSTLDTFNTEMNSALDSQDAVISQIIAAVQSKFGVSIATTGGS